MAQSILEAVFGSGQRVEFTAVTCGKCGVVFGLPTHLYSTLRESHDTFYCPNGHPRAFLGKTEAEKLRDQLSGERAKFDQERAARLDAEAQARAARGQVTKIKNRVGRGVCPCCNRTFEQLTRHMKTKHPEYHTAK